MLWVPSSRDPYGVATGPRGLSRRGTGTRYGHTDARSAGMGESRQQTARGFRIRPVRCDTHRFEDTWELPQPPPPNPRRRNRLTHPELRKQALPETPY